MKLSIVASALLIGFCAFTGSAMSADDTGRITIRGEIVNGDAPCLIGHSAHDQAVTLSAAKTTAFSLDVKHCAAETLNSITASFDTRAVIINNSASKTANTTSNAMLLSFTASNEHASSISQLTLAYE